MGGVDRADQMRTTYGFQRRCYRTWFPLWNFLRETTITNIVILLQHHYSGKKIPDFHLQVRRQLALTLMAQIPDEERPSQATKRAALYIDGMENTITSKDCVAGYLPSPYKKARYCSPYSTNGRSGLQGPRKVLGELSSNSVRGTGCNRGGRKRPPRTTWGCISCKINICKRAPCWDEHINKRIN